MTSRPSSNIRFGPFELDVRSAELRKGGTRVRLPDQPFQILLMLLERPGDLISREEIRNRLWPGTTVVEFDHSINAAVKRLRNALCDSAGEPRYIETLPRRGYRFIGQVEPPVREAWGQEQFRQPADQHVEDAAPSVSESWWSPLRLRVAAVAVLVIVATSAWWYVRQAPTRWAKNVALPQVSRLVDEGDGVDAFPYLYRALQIVPDEPTLNRILREISHPLAIRTTPPGADVYVKPYTTPDGPWISIGRSPSTISFFRSGLSAGES